MKVRSLSHATGVYAGCALEFAQVGQAATCGGRGLGRGVHVRKAAYASPARGEVNRVWRQSENKDHRALVTSRRGRAMQQLIAILPRRHLEPSPAGAEKTTLIGKAQQIGRLSQRQMQTAEILVCQLAAGIVQQ